MKHAPSSNSFQTKLKVFRKLMFIIFCLLACGAGMVLLLALMAFVMFKDIFVIIKG